MIDLKNNEDAKDLATKPSASDASASGSDRPKSVEKLSAEEQMALYEKELKENDWGHQPC